MTAREHIVQLNPDQRQSLQTWLKHPNGSLRLGRACFEAVQGGGILIRTDAYAWSAPNKQSRSAGEDLRKSRGSDQ